MRTFGEMKVLRMCEGRRREENLRIEIFRCSSEKFLCAKIMPLASWASKLAIAARRRLKIEIQSGFIAP